MDNKTKFGWGEMRGKRDPESYSTCNHTSVHVLRTCSHYCYIEHIINIVNDNVLINIPVKQLGRERLVAGCPTSDNAIAAILFIYLLSGGYEMLSFQM